MNKNDNMKLIEGSRYRIISIGGRDNTLETEGIFRGFASLGIDEGGLTMELSETHGDMSGKIRILPLQAILAIDVLDTTDTETKEEEKDTPTHFYG